VVQRALKALEHAGLVEIERGRIHVIDAEALSGWTDQTVAKPIASGVFATASPSRGRGAKAPELRMIVRLWRRRSRTNSVSTSAWISVASFDNARQPPKLQDAAAR
jgi:hypothetical protein